MSLDTVARFRLLPLIYQNSDVFVVDIQRGALVEDLWRAIYAHPRLKKYVDETLRLYKYSGSLPRSGRFNAVMDWFRHKTDEDALLNSEKLAMYFPEGPLAQDHAIDIIVVVQQSSTNIAGASFALNQLNEFCRELWKGNLSVMRSKDSFNYLDLSAYRRGLQLLLSNPPSLILIREEYLTAYQVLLDQFTCDDGVPAWVIMGQPGIGKTWFLFYVLFRCLSAHQPVAMEFTNDRYFFFTGQGVHSCKDKHLNPDFRVWALSNSGGSLSGPSVAFETAPQDRVYLIQATSPRVSRWKHWAKERDAELYVMDVWMGSELRNLGKLIFPKTPNALVEAAHVWGPSPRNLVLVTKGRRTDRDLQTTINAQIKTFLSHSTAILFRPEEINGDEFASNIIFLRPSDPLSSDYRDRRFYVPWIPTESIATAIAVVLKAQDAARQASFFDQMSDHPLSRSTAGWIFEAWVHTRLLMGDSIPCFWRSTPPGDDCLPTLSREELLQGNVDVLRSCSPDQPFYWKPSASNFPGIDSVLYHDKTRRIFAIQSTISVTHRSVEAGLDKVKASLPVKFRTLGWYLVYVTPNDTTAHQLMRKAKLPSTWSNVHIGACAISLTAAHSLVYSERGYMSTNYGEDVEHMDTTV